jgi:hypothetical protein
MLFPPLLFPALFLPLSKSELFLFSTVHVYVQCALWRLCHIFCALQRIVLCRALVLTPRNANISHGGAFSCIALSVEMSDI